MEKHNFRSYILTRSRLNVPGDAIHLELVTAWGAHAPSRATVFNWLARFNAGDESIEDRPRIGRPITETRSENIELVQVLIEDNPHISFTLLEVETGISRNTLQRIVHDRMGMRKVTSRWVPYSLSAAHKRKRVACCQHNLAMFNSGKWRLSDVFTGDEAWFYHRKIDKRAANSSWVYEDEEPRTVVRRDRYEPKSMFSIFFKSNGPLNVDCMDSGETIDNNYYIENCLRPTVDSIKKQRPTSGVKNMKILHDGARPHIHKNVKNFLEQEGIAIIDHPPYSPDLAPCDFWLFDKIKKDLDSHINARSLKKQITEILNLIGKEEYLKTLNKWLERMQLCIESDGDYFEHLIK
jgi:histone-lysine N-methyltransferase SETMAR